MLPTLSVTDLANFVADARHMPHPRRGYTVPERVRSEGFNALLDSVFSAIDSMLAGYPQGTKPWCDVVQHQAPSAHYAILRLWEQDSHRYFIYLKDTSTAGTQEAYIIINPEPTRNLLIEVPHARDSQDPKTYEDYTAQEGAKVFKDLGARALLINGATRCASPTLSRCTGGTTTQCRPDGSSQPVTVADAAHNTTTFFYLANQRFNRRYSTIKIAQLHGKTNGLAQARVIAS
jgi:hypothetical protein